MRCRLPGFASSVKLTDANAAGFGELNVVWLQGEMEYARAMNVRDAARNLRSKAPKELVVVHPITAPQLRVPRRRLGDNK